MDSLGPGFHWVVGYCCISYVLLRRRPALSRRCVPGCCSSRTAIHACNCCPSFDRYIQGRCPCLYDRWCLFGLPVASVMFDALWCGALWLSCFGIIGKLHKACRSRRGCSRRSPLAFGRPCEGGCAELCHHIHTAALCALCACSLQYKVRGVIFFSPRASIVPRRSEKCPFLNFLDSRPADTSPQPDSPKREPVHSPLFEFVTHSEYFDFDASR